MLSSKESKGSSRRRGLGRPAFGERLSSVRTRTRNEASQNGTIQSLGQELCAYAAGHSPREEDHRASQLSGEHELCGAG